MIEGKWFAQGADITVPLTLRQAVFGRGRDALDDMAQQVVVYREGEPVGAARLWWADGDFHAGDIGVAPDRRGAGYGDLLVRLLAYKASTHGARCLVLQSPSALRAFFERFGFTADAPQGEPALMRLQLTDGGCAGCGKCKGSAAE